MIFFTTDIKQKIFYIVITITNKLNYDNNKKHLHTIRANSREWMNRHGLRLLRISLGIVFFWFGFLKYFPGVSPAQDLAINTITLLTFGLLSPKVIIVGLATWEVLIGLGFITGKFLRVTLILLFSQMLGTFAPVFIFPSDVFTAIPYGPTLEGQYIIKNIVLISAGFIIGGSLMKKGAVLKSERNISQSNRVA